MTNVLAVDPRKPAREAIQRAADILHAGGLVGFPTETVYGLGANALDPIAVRKIFAAKERPAWDPAIVHVRDIATAHTLMRSNSARFEQLASRFWPGPLTLVVAKAAHVPDEVTAGRPTIALRMPWHPVAAALLNVTGLPVAAPSANRFGHPSPTCAAHVLHDLDDRVDLILDAGPTPLGVESTVLDLTQTPPAILRPGGISREQLDLILGPIQLTAPISDQAARQGIAGPGMTTKHYAPRAPVELFDNDRQLQARAAEFQRLGKRAGLLPHDPNIEHLAQTLFAQLRQLDADGVEVILCVLPPPEGLGLAVRDRLQRAAGQPPV